MSQQEQSNAELSAAEEARLVALLEEFEAALKSSTPPTIEPFLHRVEARLRPHLLGDLIRIEQELCPSTRPSLADYLQRFAREESIVREALQPERNSTNGTADRSLVGHEPSGKQIAASEHRPTLVAETAELLRTRLLVLAWIVAAGLGVFLLRALLTPGMPMLWLRGIGFAVALVACWRLHSSRSAMEQPWRAWEPILVVLFAVHAIALQLHDTIVAASQVSAVDVNSATIHAFFTWSVGIALYATLIPNTWRRAAAVLLPAAAIPLVATLLIMWLHRATTSLLRYDSLIASVLLTSVATTAALTGIYFVHTLRKEIHMARKFGPYRLLRRLGAGGMGEVYLAEHDRLKRPAAIKLIRPGFDTRSDIVERFEREVQAAARLSHWNTIEIFDFGRTDDGTFFYVMEYLEGLSLAELVEQHGPLPPGRVVHFLCQLCDALAEAHAAGLIHQDIKPANVLAVRYGARSDVAKLLDFGLVHEVITTDAPHAPIQSRGHIVGTPRFMAPEQARGSHTPNPQSDIYSLGATAYYLLTGRAVFERATVNQVLQAHLNEPVQSPRELLDTIPTDLEQIILRCLEKQPNRRYAHILALRADLVQCACCNSWSTEQANAWWQQKQ